MLFWIVQRAARRIQVRQQALEQRRQALTAANQELRAVQSQLVTAERLAAIGEVVAAVAHGIRNPLSNIRAVAQVAMLDAREEKPHACMTTHLRQILSEVDRLAGRLRDLLHFVRPTERTSQPVDLHSVLRNAMEFMAGRLHHDTVAMQTHLAPTLPPIMGDAMLLEEIVMSLLGNAIEAVGTADGVITVTTGTCAAIDGSLQVFLDLEDTGHGMTAEEIPKIFEPFYTRKAQGTGLGLAVARKFAEAHHGTITVQSQPGVGSRFRVAFPAHHEV
jgi:signal transduction histidine kinase